MNRLLLAAFIGMCFGCSSYEGGGLATEVDANVQPASVVLCDGCGVEKATTACCGKGGEACAESCPHSGTPSCRAMNKPEEEEDDDDGDDGSSTKMNPEEEEDEEDDDDGDGSGAKEKAV